MRNVIRAQFARQTTGRCGVGQNAATNRSYKKLHTLSSAHTNEFRRIGTSMGRIALGVELSSFRVVAAILGEAEQNIPRGWDFWDDFDDDGG